MGISFPLASREVALLMGIALGAASLCPSPGGGQASRTTLAWEDVTEANGLLEPLRGMHAHAVAAGHAGTGTSPDLFVGTFADRPDEVYRERGAGGAAPDRLLVARGVGYEIDHSFPEVRSRTSGATFADLDGDGDAELIAARNLRRQQASGPAVTIYERRPDGWRSRGELPRILGARAVVALDFDGDRDLDLFVAADRWQGGSSRLLRNDGAWEFADVTRSAGLPDDLVGFGAVAADLTSDRRPDLLVAGSNRLFVNEGGRFSEVAGAPFEWQTHGAEDDVSGVDVGDVNRDGRLDVVLGHHFNSTLDQGIAEPVRLYLNEGTDPTGGPALREITAAAGLDPLPTKAPHVELVDLDNDGWPDVLTSASVTPGPAPAVFRHRGIQEGLPRFEAPHGSFTDQYWVTGATLDFDADGRLDVFLAEWFPTLPSPLFRNVGPERRWIAVGGRVPDADVVGARVEIYEPGYLGSVDALLGAAEVLSTRGYAAGALPRVHMGVGDRSSVDVRVLPAWGAPPIEIERAAADRFHCVLGRCSGS